MSHERGGDQQPNQPEQPDHPDRSDRSDQQDHQDPQELVSADSTGADDTGDAVGDAGALAAQLAVLEAENERLRRAYRDARRTRYRLTAGALVAVGVLALSGGIAFGRNAVLLALGGTGVFAGLLTYVLTPEQFLSASVGRRVYDSLAANHAAVADALGLTDRRIYYPVDDDARLFVPQHDAFDLADLPVGDSVGRQADGLDGPFVIGDDPGGRGLALTPTGAPLFEEYDRARTGEPGSPTATARALSDALVEQFELVDVADVDDAGDGRVAVGVRDSVFGPLASFDHPVPSLLATGLAHALDRPVETTVADPADDRYDALVVCAWSEDDGEDVDGEDEFDDTVVDDEDQDAGEAAEDTEDADDDADGDVDADEADDDDAQTGFRADGSRDGSER